MTTETILKLVEAGFDKADIMKLAGVSSNGGQTQTPTEPIVPIAKDVLPTVTEEKKDPEPMPNAKAESNNVTMSEEQFTAFMQKLNASGASLDVPPQYDVTKILGDHYKDIMVGK